MNAMPRPAEVASPVPTAHQADGRPEPECSAMLWTAPETASYLRVPVATLYRWRYLGEGPPAHRVGRHLRFVPDEVQAWLREQ